MNFVDKAIQLHKNNVVVDAHLDLAGEIYNRNQNDETEIIKKYYLDNFKKAGINIVVSSLYIDNMFLPEMGLRIALGQINALIEDVETVKDEVMIIKSREDLDYVIANNKIGIIISFEGLDPIGNDLKLLRPFYDLGVRGATLTWSRRNYVADGCFFRDRIEGKKGGLTDFGVKVLEKMQDLGMFIDVSHLNDEGFWDVIKFVHNPIIASHSNSREVKKSMRNLTDEQIKALADKGGVMGLNAYISFSNISEGDDKIVKLCDHIEHIVKLVGPEHSGFGFDLCDSYYLSQPRFEFSNKNDDGLKDHTESILLSAELLRRGLSEEDVKLIIGGNFVRVFRQILK